MANVNFKTGKRSDFEALLTKDPNTLYWLTDTNEIYKGDILFGVGRLATQTAAGLLSAEDKAKLDHLTGGVTAGLTPVDATILIGDGEDGAKTIGVQISKDETNLIEIKNDGLYVSVDTPEYTIEKLDEATEGYSATYRLKKTVNGSDAYIGAEINIPKDLVVQSGSIQTVTETDQPYTGAQVGDAYIELVLSDATASHIYIPTKGLVDTSNFVTQEIINGDGGKAIIINEPTGGGAKYHAPDGTQAFVGVNDGGLGGLMAQIYADKQDDEGNWLGSRINVYHDHIYYTSLADKEAGKANDAAECEIATKGDVSEVQDIIGSLPNEFISEIASVSRTETTNVAQLRLSIKQEDGTYSTAQEHGVLTLIPAGEGPDGVSGAGLMSLADKQKLDSIDPEVIESLSESLVWGTM